MINCRSIPQETWEHARKALVFYFSRRCGLTDAEDQAQETIAVIWKRQDYQFQSEDDFLKVCYGFARRIRLKALRDAGKNGTGTFDPNLHAVDGGGGARSIESKILLDEVCRVGEQELRDDEWGVIWRRAMAVESDGRPEAPDPRESNRIRVQLHRARHKLAALAGWKRG
jgi:DNA-directed RNA polymerase specialized sigma24 family protein